MEIFLLAASAICTYGGEGGWRIKMLGHTLIGGWIVKVTNNTKGPQQLSWSEIWVIVQPRKQKPAMGSEGKVRRLGSHSWCIKNRVESMH
jgi:hypothetical protein